MRAFFQSPHRQHHAAALVLVRCLRAIAALRLFLNTRVGDVRLTSRAQPQSMGLLPTSGFSCAPTVLLQVSIPPRVALFLVALLIVPPHVTAQDRVTIQRAGSSSRVAVTGRIQDFTGEELILETGVGVGVQRFPIGEIVEVSTRYTPAHELGLQLLKAGRAAEAWDQLATAVESENRKWVRREILSLQVRSALHRGAYVDAVTRFLAIASSDPLTAHYRLIPLVWTESAPASLPIAELKAWMVSKDLAAQLIGASWLLDGPDMPLARQTLLQLAREPHPYVQRLAQAQLWRVRLREPNLSPRELQNWEQQRDEWSPVIRSGPSFLLGTGHGIREEWLSASAHWLRVALVENERRDLAAEAHWRATQALERAGDPAAALRLAQELSVRYADLPQALAARELTARLSAPAPSATMPPGSRP